MLITISKIEGSYIFVTGLSSNQKTGPENIIFPIPIIFDNQIPICLNVTVNNQELISNLTIKCRNNINLMVDLTLCPMDAKQEFHLDWECFVLIADNVDLPKASLLIGDVEAYLNPSLCVQVDHPEIQNKAISLVNKDSKLDTAKNIVAFLQEIKEKSDRNYKSLDALEALHHGGSCVSAANLATSLFRANGVPTIILATHPTWFPRHQTHYILKAFIEDRGWIRIDPSVGKIFDPPRNNIVVSAVTIEDENKSVSRWQYPMQGVPYMSLPENPTEGDICYACPKGGPHKAEVVKKFDDSLDLINRAFELATLNWQYQIKLFQNEPILPKVSNKLMDAVHSENLADFITMIEPIVG